MYTLNLMYLTVVIRTTMNMLRVNKVQRYLFEVTASVTSCCTPNCYIFAIFSPLKENKKYCKIAE